MKLIHDHKSLHCITSKFFDLQYVNHSFYDTQKIYSFIRYHENDEYLLFILNFDYKNSHDIQVAIPDDVWQTIGLDIKKVYKLREIFIDKKLQLELRANKNLHLKLPNNHAYVFQIEE